MATRHDEIAKNVTNFNADDNASASTEIIEIENAETVPALTLPPEILWHVCGYLSRKDTLNLRLSHSRFRDHVNMIPSTFSLLVVANDLKTIFLYNGSVFTCGQNRFGELGHGDTADKLSPTHIDRAVFQGKKVEKVVAGIFHYTFFLCNDGSVFICGDNDYGHLLEWDRKTVRLSPTLINSDVFQGKQVGQVVASSYHTIFLCKDGSVFTCGRNNYGQLGHGDTTDKLSPTLINSDVFQGKQVEQVVAGSFHTIFLCKDGSVFTCGCNTYGQLGHGNTRNKLSPMHIDRAVFQGKKVVQVVASGSHTIFLCKDGSVFTCGDNDFGQLGHGDTTDKLSPTRIDRAVFDYKRVVQVVASGFNSFFFCENGRVFSCGENTNGQLGLNDTTNRLLPTEVLALYNPYCEAMRLRKVLLDKIVALNQNKEGFKEKVGKAVQMVLEETKFSPAIPGALLKVLNMLNGEPCYNKASAKEYKSQLEIDIEELTDSKVAQAPFAPLFQKTLREIGWLEELAERDTDGQSLNTRTMP